MGGLRDGFPDFKIIGWYDSKGELHHVSDEQKMNVPNPGELVEDALSAPPPEPNDETVAAGQAAVAELPDDD